MFLEVLYFKDWRELFFRETVKQRLLKYEQDILRQTPITTLLIAPMS